MITNNFKKAILVSSIEELNASEDIAYFEKDGWVHIKFVELADKYKGGNFTEKQTGEIKHLNDSALGSVYFLIKLILECMLIESLEII